MSKRKHPVLTMTAVCLAVCALSSVAYGQSSRGGGGGGGSQPPAEGAASNLSFPVILSDNMSPAAFPVDGAWRFASVTNPGTECVGEGGVPAGSAVPSTTNCYYGRHVSVVSETGTIAFDGAEKVWWLQKRTPNFWKAFSVGYNNPLAKLAVSAVDVGDLLESSPSIGARQIRTEFNLMQSVDAADPQFGAFVVPSWSGGVPSPCVIPTTSGQSVGCFAALGMSGAVPGTQQTINEAQGTDFGPGAGAYPGTVTLLDPTTVRTASDAAGTLPIHASVYSHCARLLIQKIDGTPSWDPAAGQWAGPGVGAPVANLAAYSGAYSSEINSGGGIVYGYNWNAKTASTGTYRLTFVIDGNDAQGPQCTTLSTTEFKAGTTRLVNVGEANASHLVPAGDALLNGGDEGGLVYIDLALATKSGGGSAGGGGAGGGGGGSARGGGGSAPVAGGGGGHR